MYTIKIFLASSNELEVERDKFASLINQLNRIYKQRGVEIELVVWEYLNSSVGRKRKQEEYNDEIKKSDICLTIFWTELGKYTREEFQLAFDELIAGRNPKRLYVFFKEPANASEELQQFKDSFERDYGHFYSKFENADTLRLQFLLQLELFENDFIDFGEFMRIENSKIIIGGVAFVNLQNLAFTSNNATWILLQRQIEKQKIRLTKYPEDMEEQRELHLLLDKRQKMEEGMLELAKKISKHTLYKMSSRMISVRKLFEIGEFYAVLKILDSQDIMADIRSYKTRIELCDTLKEQLLTDIGHSINELLLRIKTEKILLEEGGMHKIISEYELLIEETRGYVLPLKFATLLFDAAKFIDEYNPNMLAASYYIECIEIMERESTHTEDELALYGNMLYSAGKFFSKKVFEIDIDPTSGEWMDCVNKEIRAEVLKRWKTYKKRAIGYLEKSVDIFSSINKKGRYMESVYFSLDALTNGFIWGYCEEKEKKAYKKLISFIRSSTLSDEFLLSAFCGYANVYIRNNKDDVAQKEISIICQECEKILSILECSSLNPKVLLKISSIFEMKNDFQKAAKFCRLALNGYEELAQESPYIYQTSIAYSLEKLAQFVSWYTENYKINPETFCLLDRTEEIYNKL